MLPQIKDRLNNAPIGTIARRYIRPVILTVFLPSRSFVVRASTWVMRVANSRCHVVSTTAAEIHSKLYSHIGAEMHSTYDNLQLLADIYQRTGNRVTRAEHIRNFHLSRICLLNMMIAELRDIQVLRVHSELRVGANRIMVQGANIHHVYRWVKARGWHLFFLDSRVDGRQNWRGRRLGSRPDNLGRDTLFLALNTHPDVRDLIEERTGVKRS